MPLTTVLPRAVALAAYAHSMQVDKAGAPYIFHPLRVMEAVRHLGLDHAIVAVLHDVIEDTDVKSYHLSAIDVPEALIDAVLMLTHQQRSRETYEQYLKRCATSTLTRAVKLADLRDNANVDRLLLIQDVPTRKRLYHKYREAIALLESYDVANQAPDSTTR